VATLVITFPFFVWVTRYLKKDVIAHPEKRELRIRKWLLYLTLFIAGIVVIGDLVALVYSFLQGELTLRFILKILSIFLIAGSIFYYYLNEVREHRASPYVPLLSKIVVGLVSGAVIVGFFVVGSPFAQRDNRLDERRVGDLSIIQSQLINYWQNKGALPAKLDDLNSDISGFRVPVDPKTGQAYTYTTSSDRVFSLCADFQTSTRGLDYRPTAVNPVPYEELQSNWFHDAGHHCFDRTIDPDFYPPVQKTPAPSPKVPTKVVPKR
jgi:hypothetical protein